MPLREELLHTLEPLKAHSSDQVQKRIDSVMRKLSTSRILPDDFEKVYGFIFLLTQEIPGILTHPDSEPLKELCLYCLDQLRLESEMDDSHSFKSS